MNAIETAALESDIAKAESLARTIKVGDRVRFGRSRAFGKVRALRQEGRHWFAVVAYPGHNVDAHLCLVAEHLTK